MSKTKYLQFLKSLEELRIKTGLTCNEFSTFLGVTPQAYYGWKRGSTVTEFVIASVEAYNLLNTADVKFLVEQRKV